MTDTTDPHPLGRIGAHVSVAGGPATAFARAADLGCAAMQIFVKNANQWQGKPLLDPDVEAFRQARGESPIGAGGVLAHASYLINLAATDPAILARSRAALLDELTRCSRLGVDGLVVHPGAHLGSGEECGVDRVAESLELIFAQCSEEVTTPVLLENTAGQGSCLGHRLEHLGEIRRRVQQPERVGVCIDTCHAFAAGYPLHEPAGYEEFFAELSATIGLEPVRCFHLNDSVRPFGSRRDRHAHLGEGEIGLGLFARLLHDPRVRHVPMILETDPEDGMEGHRRDLTVLRSLL